MHRNQNNTERDRARLLVKCRLDTKEDTDTRETGTTSLAEWAEEGTQVYVVD